MGMSEIFQTNPILVSKVAWETDPTAVQALISVLVGHLPHPQGKLCQDSQTSSILLCTEEFGLSGSGPKNRQKSRSICSMQSLPLLQVGRLRLSKEFDQMQGAISWEHTRADGQAIRSAKIGGDTVL